MTENERLTHKRINGIKEGHWSPRKKEELLQRLGKYEDTGMEPEEISAAIGKKLDTDILQRMNTQIHLLKELRKARKWIPVEEQLPENDRYILLSFANFSLPMVGHYEINEDGSGAFYLGDCNEEDTCVSQDLIVNAWMPLPGPYRPDLEHEEAEDET